MEFIFILVEPIVPENIGFVARVLKTMGFSNLWLVSPCDHLSRSARKTGYQSHDILENALVFSSLESAIQNIDLVIGTTAKKRDGRHDYHHPRKLKSIIQGKADGLKSVGIVFGREARGLSNEELDLCDLISTIPLSNSYPSLNLSHSAMVYAYEIANLPSRSLSDSRPATIREGQELKKAAEDLILWLGIDKKSSLKKRILDRLSLAKSTDDGTTAGRRS